MILNFTKNSITDDVGPIKIHKSLFIFFIFGPF